VYNGGSATGTTVEAGAFQDVFHGSVTGTNLSGSQQVLDGATADQTVIQSGGNAYVGTGGAVTATTVNAGGLLYVDAGGSAAGSTIDGGFTWVAGTASNTTLNSGELDVTGSATGTHLAGGVEHVLAGGVQNSVDFAGAAATLTLDD
ncbi:autotransporter outer membrane beta-barrel domain-containing protein, partial [Pseudomonas fluorescens]|nr:autotransporter outer membrane beta-barrel domain-containing protein [Pseudomonas fluorescens]